MLCIDILNTWCEKKAFHMQINIRVLDVHVQYMIHKTVILSLAVQKKKINRCTVLFGGTKNFNWRLNFQLS